KAREMSSQVQSALQRLEPQLFNLQRRRDEATAEALQAYQGLIEEVLKGKAKALAREKAFTSELIKEQAKQKTIRGRTTQLFYLAALSTILAVMLLVGSLRVFAGQRDLFAEALAMQAIASEQGDRFSAAFAGEPVVNATGTWAPLNGSRLWWDKHGV